MLSAVQGVSLEVGVLGYANGKTCYGTEGNDGRSDAVGVDRTLAKFACIAVATGADRSAIGGWREQQRRCAPVSSQSPHGVDVAHAICETRSGRIAQRAQTRSAAQHQRGTDCR